MLLSVGCAQASPTIGADVQSDQMAESRTNLAWDTLLELGGRPGPLHARLSGALREAIREGRLPAGSALPPSRVLAEDLGCSRWVVTEAYAQLAAEGYLEARGGSGPRARPLGQGAADRPGPRPGGPAIVPAGPLGGGPAVGRHHPAPCRARLPGPGRSPPAAPRPGPVPGPRA